MGQGIDVGGRGDEARHLDVERALARVERAAGDHHVVLGERIEQLPGREVIGLEPVHIDGHGQHLVAGTRDGDALRRRDRFERILQVLGALHQRAFRHAAVERHRDRRDVRERNLVHRRLGRVVRQFGGDAVELGADVGQRLVLVGVDVELEEDRGMAGRRGRGVVLEPVEILDAILDRLDQQALGVARRHARLAYRDVEVGDVDRREAFLGQRHVGAEARHQQDQHDRQHDPRHAQDALEEVHHDCTPSAETSVEAVSLVTLVAFTVSPAVTNSCPSVMMSTFGGSPVTQTPSRVSFMMVTG